MIHLYHLYLLYCICQNSYYFLFNSFAHPLPRNLSVLINLNPFSKRIKLNGHLWFTPTQFSFICSTKAWVKHWWCLKSFDVFNGHYRFHWRLSIDHVCLTTPYSNCKSTAFGRRFLQICIIPIYNVVLLDVLQFLRFLL